MTERTMVVLSAVLGFILTSCVSSIDAYIVNPCDKALKIETHNTSFAESRIHKRATLGPETVTKIEDAFQTTSGSDWSITIQGSDDIVRVDGDSWTHDTVVIPAEVCDEIS